MDHTTNQPPKQTVGGDRLTPQAKLETAQREETIVALRLQKVSYAGYVEGTLAAFSGATAGLQRRTGLLWWKEACIHPAHA